MCHIYAQMNRQFALGNTAVRSHHRLNEEPQMVHNFDVATHNRMQTQTFFVTRDNFYEPLIY